MDGQLVKCMDVISIKGWASLQSGRRYEKTTHSPETIDKEVRLRTKWTVDKAEPKGTKDSAKPGFGSFRFERWFLSFS